MDYNSRLKNLITDKDYIVAEIKGLDKSKFEELQEAKLLIEEKYSELKQKSLSELDRKTQELYNYCKLIEKNSTMSSEIFNVITELISFYEREPYILQRLNYRKDKIAFLSVLERIMIIPKSILEGIKKPNYMENLLLKSDVTIKIFTDRIAFSLADEISFYKTVGMGTLNPTISFKGFPYIKKFIDYIINYRMENKIDKLSKEDMQKLKENFILLNIESISYEDTNKSKKC